MSGKHEAVSLCRGNTRQLAHVGEPRGSEPMSGKHEAVSLCRETRGSEPMSGKHEAVSLCRGNTRQ